FLRIKSGCGLAANFSVFSTRRRKRIFRQFPFLRQSSLGADWRAIFDNSIVCFRVAEGWGVIFDLQLADTSQKPVSDRYGVVWNRCNGSRATLCLFRVAKPYRV